MLMFYLFKGGVFMTCQSLVSDGETGRMDSIKDDCWQKRESDPKGEAIFMPFIGPVAVISSI